MIRQHSKKTKMSPSKALWVIPGMFCKQWEDRRLFSLLWWAQTYMSWSTAFVERRGYTEEGW